MADQRDPYKTLQVDPEADPEVVQAAYRRLAQKYHPDVTADDGAAVRMAAINAAWELLRDPDRRAAHDRERATRERERATRERDRSSEPERAAPVPEASRPATSPPPGRPSGSVLNFGRYAGWSLGEIARADLEYIEWLDRTPIGRPYRDEIDGILRLAGRRRSAAEEATDRRGLFRRR